MTITTRLDRLERLLSLGGQLASLRVHRAHGGGNPYHDEHGKFTTGGGAGLSPEHRKKLDDFREYSRGEQSEQHAEHKAARKELIREQHAEHKALRREQAAERKALPKEHAKELKELDREHARDRKDQEKDQDRERRELAKDHAKELKAADPEDHAGLMADHAQAVSDLHQSHADDRANLHESQRIEREHYVESHAAAIAEQAELHRQARDDQREEFRATRREAHENQVEEKKELRDRLRDELKELKAEIKEDIGGGRSSPASVVRTSHRFGPGRTLKASSAEAILATCLKRTGLGKAFRKGTIAGPDRLRLLETIRDYGRAWLHHEAAAFLAAHGERTLHGVIGQHAKRLFSRMKGFIKELYVAGAMALLGPRALTEKELRAIDHQHQAQAMYFDRFEAQTGKTPTMPGPDGTPVVIGPEPRQPLDGTFPARAEQYGASVWGASQEVARATAGDTFDEERRVHVGDDEPCPQCVEEQARGWTSPGTLRPIGDCYCRINCHCHFEYRADGDDRIYYAGDTLGSFAIDA